MGVVVQLGRSEHSRIKSDQANFTIGTGGGKDAGNCIVGGISFDDEGRIGLIMGKDGSCREGYYFEGIEQTPTLLGKVPRGVLLGEPSEGDHDVGVIINESTIEIGEAQKGLDILYLSGLRPVADGLDFVLGHCQSRGCETVPKVLHGFRVELTFFRFGIQAVLLQTAKHFPNVCSVILLIVQID